MDISLSVAYKEDLQRVISILEEIAAKNPVVLDEPEPLIILQDFGTNGVELTFAVWHERENFLKVKNSVFLAIKETFAREGIEIPVMHISLYAGNVTKPIPVKIETH